MAGPSYVDTSNWSPAVSSGNYSTAEDEPQFLFAVGPLDIAAQWACLMGLPPPPGYPLHAVDGGSFAMELEKELGYRKRSWSEASNNDSQCMLSLLTRHILRNRRIA